MKTRPGLARTSSEEPPPMSNKTALSAAESTSEAEPAAASRASVSRSTISSSSPVASRTLARKLGAVACRAASLRRNHRARVTPRARILSRQIFERAQGAFDRRRAQLAGSRQTFAQPDNPGKRVDDAKTVLAAACWHARAIKRRQLLCRDPGPRKCAFVPATAVGH